MYPLPDFSCISIYIICMICITHTYIINTHIHIHVYTHMHYTKVVSYCVYCCVICFYHLIAYCKQFSMSIIVFTQHHNRQQEQKCKPTPSPPGVTAWTLWDPTFRSHLLLTDGESTNKRLALGNVPVLSGRLRKTSELYLRRSGHYTVGFPKQMKGVQRHCLYKESG